MKPELIAPTVNSISNFAHSVKRTRKQRCSRALALAIMLGLAVAPLSAQGQTLTVLYSFTGGIDGSNPDDGLLLGSTGRFYGTTISGGLFGEGALFSVSLAGHETVLHQFSENRADGSVPITPLAQDSLGYLYGTTSEGGSPACDTLGCGTVFRLNPSVSNSFVVLHSFAHGGTEYIPNEVLVDSSANVFGTAQGGRLHHGGVFEIDSAGKYSVLYSFSGGNDGSNPLGGLLLSTKGTLYGTTHDGGAFNQGVIFKLSGSGVETVLYTFTGGADGAHPQSRLVLDNSSNLCGTTSGGGTAGLGTVFKLDKTGKETVLHSFTGGADGGTPNGDLIRDQAGNLYGVTPTGGAFNLGTVFKVDAATGTESVVYSFTGGTNAKFPNGNLVLDTAGNFYGAAGGGAFGFGTVFKLAP